MNPENVNTRKFEVENIIFTNRDFSIAYGIWEGNERLLGMRWNGENNQDPGYPKTFNNPVWFMVSKELTIPFLTSILYLSDSDETKVKEALKKELKVQ